MKRQMTESSIRHKMKSITNGDTVVIAVEMSLTDTLGVVTGVVKNKDGSNFDLVRADIARTDRVENRQLMALDLRLPVVAIVRINSADDLDFAVKMITAELRSFDASTVN